MMIHFNILIIKSTKLAKKALQQTDTIVLYLVILHALPMV